MAKSTSKLINARKIKLDEFYTHFSDIEKEINAYLEYNPNIFVDKIIHCPCDADWSNFSHYFANNFKRLGLKRLIMTCYNESNKGFYAIVDKDFNKDGVINIKDVEFKELVGDGDFRSDEIKEFMKMSDFVFTNPPFSLFREFVYVMFELNKNFSIVGNQNAISYKHIFPLLKENKLFLGANKINIFKEPDGNLKKFGNICWFTNILHSKLYNSTKDFYKTIEENEDIEYYRYDNYNAINVCRTKDIPRDYEGIMGVPISFMDKYNPELFEIVRFRKGNDNKDLVYKDSVGNRINPYARILIKWKK